MSLQNSRPEFQNFLMIMLQATFGYSIISSCNHYSGYRNKEVSGVGVRMLDSRLRASAIRQYPALHKMSFCSLDFFTLKSQHLQIVIMRILNTVLALTFIFSASVVAVPNPELQLAKRCNDFCSVSQNDCCEPLVCLPDLTNPDPDAGVGANITYFVTVLLISFTHEDLWHSILLQ